MNIFLFVNDIYTLQASSFFVWQIFNIITERELKVSDVDTPPDKILFVITAPPKHGRLVKMTELDEPITTFTQGKMRTQDNFLLVVSCHMILLANKFH